MNESESPKTVSTSPSPGRAWAAWLNLLGPAARAALTGGSADPESLTYAEWREGLTESARAAVDARVAPDNVPDTEPSAEPSQPGWYLVECHDGALPVLQKFSTLADLAKRIGTLDGQDVAGWAFRGDWLPFSKGPRRCVELPGGQGAVTVPTGGVGKVEPVAAEFVDLLECQDDGYLGPAELIEGVVAPPPPPKPRRPPPPKKPDPPAGDEEDDGPPEWAGESS